MRHLDAFKTIGITDTLAHCPLFAGLPPDDLASIAEVTQLKSLKKGDFLFHAGDPSDGFYIVRHGSINIHRTNNAGGMHVVHIFRANESFGEAALAMPDGYPANARALEPTGVLFVQKEGMLALIRHNPELALRIITSLSAHIRIIVDKLEDVTFKDLETRFVNWLLKHCPEPDSDRPCEILLTIPKRVLASQLGTICQTFSRALAKLREQKLITVRGKLITVLSPARLKKSLR